MIYLKKILYYYFSFFKLRGRKFSKKWDYLNSPKEKIFKDSPFKVGIVKEAWNMHYHYILACNELQISYKIIDIFSYNWIEEFKQSDIDIFLVRPSVQYSTWKHMFDNRIKLLSDTLKIKIHPNPEILWLWESKIKTYEWLKLNNYPHIDTWIFYNEKEALDFAMFAKYPLVYKADIGSGSSGVKIIKNSFQLKKRIKKCFGRGVRSYRKHIADKEHGFIILQKYLPDLVEWRVIRMGKSFFAFQKLRSGKFHSGSHKFSYGMPPQKALHLVKNITDKHAFKHTSIDVFIDNNENIYINEIQPYFGQYQDRELLRIEGKTGRLFFDQQSNSWIFEQGTFCKNNMANLRLLTIFD